MVLRAIALLFGKTCKNYRGEIKAAHQILLQFARSSGIGASIFGSAAASGGRVSGIF